MPIGVIGCGSVASEFDFFLTGLKEKTGNILVRNIKSRTANIVARKKEMRNPAVPKAFPALFEQKSLSKVRSV